MPDEKKEDPRLAAARKRAAALGKATAGTDGKRQGPISFLKEVRDELKKSTWPDRETLTKSTAVVLTFIAAIGAWIFVLNYVLTNTTTSLFK